MGMFNEFASMSGLDSGYINEADIAEEMERLEAMPAAEMGSDSVEEMYVEAAIANERNFNTIMMSVANEEFQYFMQNGTEMVYEGARLDAFFEKIKSMLDKAWQKIKAIFEKALNHVKAWTASDKAFIDKYKDKILAASGRVLEIDNTYKIDITQVRSNYFTQFVDQAKEVFNTYEGGKGMDAGGKKKRVQLTSSDIDDMIYGTDGSRESVMNDYKEIFGLHIKQSTTLKPKEIIDELKEGKNTKDNIKIWYNDAKKAVAGLKKRIDDNKREASKTKSVDDKNSSYGALSSGCSKIISVMNGIQSLQLQAVKVYHSNCRTVARRIVAGKTYKESVEFDGDFADLLV